MVKDLPVYLRAVFVESYHVLLTIVDIIALVQIFWPVLAERLIGIRLPFRTIGEGLFFFSFILANFNAYRKLARETSDPPIRAHIHLTNVEQQKLLPSIKESGHPPFRDLREMPSRFDVEGLPDWGTLWVQIRIANHGREDGQLVLEIDQGKTKLPEFFDGTRIAIEPNVPSLEVKGRKAFNQDLFFHILMRDQKWDSFVRTMQSWIRRKKTYRLVIRYRTKGVDDESQIRRLAIKGDLEPFCRELLKLWRDKDSSALERLEEFPELFNLVDDST